MGSEVYIPKDNYLEQVVKSIWQVRQQPRFRDEMILPKGVVEIIFDLGDSAPIKANIRDKHFHLPKCFINGFNTHPIALQLPERHFFFGVQFHPVVIRDLFGVPASEFSNITVDLTLLSPLFSSLWNQLAEASTFSARVAVITRWLESKIIDLAPRDKLLSRFVADANPNVSIRQLSDTIFYSPRHISRKIIDITGMNAEQFLLYKKYLHALSLIHHTELSLTEIAYASNFSDQSHFSNAFKSFTQLSPKDYRKLKGFVPGHLNKNVR